MGNASPALIETLEQSRSRGFLGPGDVMFHVEHARGFAALLGAEPARVIDLGAGGGVPGLVVAMERPEHSITLLDSSEKRCRFLRESVERLDTGSTVLCGRAESLGRDQDLRGAFDAVISRSFGPPHVVAECAAAFLRVGGVLLVSEPPPEDTGRPPSNISRWDGAGLSKLGMEDRGAVQSLGYSYRVIVQASTCPDGYPRPVGVPVRRPLWRSR